MKQEDYKKEYNTYTGRVRLLYASALLFVALMTGASALMTHNRWVAVTVFVFGIALIKIMHLIQKTDDVYISSVVSGVSDLLDALEQLEKQDIFPASEDTLISKLQSKVEKMVTELRLQNERERMEHENIKGLVSDLSHQLKTPISNLKMYTEFLQNPAITEEDRAKYLNIIEMSVERLTFLSESMIKVSRLESGLITLDCKNQSINDTILQAIKDAYVAAKQAGITIRYEEKVKTSLLHDRRWTAEACFNLLDNAIKYGKQNQEIVLAVRELGTTIEISVRDENVIIPQEERTHIFERFYRGHNSVEKEGVGIGLYLAREIIEKQGGYLSVTAWEKGNKFVIVLRK